MQSWFKNEGPFQLRLLSAQEMDFLWTIWPMDSINEPIFVAESPNHKLVIQFMDGKGFFIDDFQDLSGPRLLELQKRSLRE